MIEPSPLRTLTLREASRPGRPAHVSAASGLVRVADRLYVIADDENHLAVFPLDGEEPGSLTRIFPGTLPVAYEARKRNKPDVEAITRMPAREHHPHGALFTLGSGSTRERCTGVLLGLDVEGALDGTPVEIDLAPLYEAIERRFGRPNIEGAVVIGDDLVLLHRGNKGNHHNARIRVHLAQAFDAMIARQALEASALIDIVTVDLGSVDGVPLGFTDGSALPEGRMVVTAVAEASKDSYEDGRCRGAALGILGADGTLERLEPLDPRYKAEGVAASVEDDVIRLWLVTDADDAEVPALLLACELPFG